jgi:K+ transporter
MVVGKESPAGSAPTAAARPERPSLAAASLVALGIVYGDIGTSPLYAFRESFLGNALAGPTCSASCR